MINLLKETQQILAEHSYSFRGVKFIQNAEGIVDIAAFVAAAADFNYDNKSGTPVIDPSICIVGSNWWLSRIVHHGTEQWFFHKKPAKPTIGSKDFMLTTKRPQSYLVNFD